MTSTTQTEDSMRHFRPMTAPVWPMIMLTMSFGAASNATVPVADSAGTLEEIVVTAQKREQNLQDVGISLTALSSESLQRLEISDSTDIVQQVPSLQFQATTTFATPSLRGVSQTEFTDQHELPVGVVVDGVYISSPGAVQTQLFDLGRVEVLRGPQGTLFGRNSTGGLIHFVTQKPTEDFSGYTKVGFGSYNEARVEGAINGALVEQTLLGRLSIAADRHDGYLKNRIGPDVLAARVYSGRGQLLYKPTSDLSVLFKLQTSINDHERNGGYTWAPAAPGPDGLGVRIGPNDNPWGTCNGCDLMGYRNPDSDPYHQAFDTQGFFDRRAYEGSATVNWELPSVTLTSVTDFYSHKKNYLEDTDASPNPLFVYATRHRLDQFSQELRVSSRNERLFWVAGLYFLNINSHFYQSLAFNFGPGVDLLGYDDRVDKTTSWAAFGQTEIPLGTQWKLVTGARWTDDTKKLDALTVNAFGDGTPVIINRGTVGGFAQRKFGDWQGKLQLEWRPQTDVLLFAGVSRGTKSGGFQGNLSVPPESLTFSEEKLTDYETGFKLTLADNKVRLNGSLFYYDYKDYQAFEFNQTTLASMIQNTPAKVKGAEFEIEARPMAPLELSLGLSVLDTKAKDIVLPSGLVVDRKLPQAPSASVNGLARYALPVGPGSIALQFDFKYNGSSYFTVNNAPVERESGYGLYNAHITYKPNDGPWEASAFVKNLSNTFYRVYSLDVSGLGFSNDRPGVPRWFGVNFTYRFAGR